MHDTTNGDTTALLDLPDPEFRSGSDGGGFRLFVIELNRDGMSTSRTELAIAITDRDPALRFAEIQRSSRERHAAIRDRGLRIRADLTPPVTWPTRSGAAQARRLLATALARDGFAVTGFDRTWRVYVIELSDEVGSRTDDRYPWVYVGETSLSVEQRFLQHIHGVRNRRGPLFSRDVHRHGTRLRPDLYANEPELFSKADAEAAERAVADRLRVIGYPVKGGH